MKVFLKPYLKQMVSSPLSMILSGITSLPPYFLLLYEMVASCLLTLQGEDVSFSSGTVRGLPEP